MFEEKEYQKKSLVLETACLEDSPEVFIGEERQVSSSMFDSKEMLLTFDCSFP